MLLINNIQNKIILAFDDSFINDENALYKRRVSKYFVFDPKYLYKYRKQYFKN